MFARTAALRTLSAAACGSARLCAVVANTAPATAAQTAMRAFSNSAMRASAVTDVELSNVLGKELTFEKTNSMAEQPDFLKDFRAAKTFTVTDKAGDNEVTLTREFGSEKITVTFSIDDVANVEPVEGEEDAVEFPVATVITVSKPAAPEVGAITFQTIADGAAFQITNVTHTAKADGGAALALEDTAEADYKRRGQYVGPIFEELDDALTAAWYDYLEARGIGSQLAEFIPAYVEYKEQREYMRWLELVKEFIDRK